MAARPGNFKVIIGVDFGTTYSGVAYGHTGAQVADIQIIREWPGKGGVFDKVPSEICYSPDGTFTWGFEATEERTHGKPVLQFFKLLLDPEQTHSAMKGTDPLGLERVRQMLPHDKEPVDVVVDYLKALMDHSRPIMEGKWGKEFWTRLPIEYHLTVPAVWSDGAKAKTLEAANRAGMGSTDSVVLIAEPEAAAHHAVLNQNYLEAGEGFVVADCGGGTVDLVTYNVISRAPQFEVNELHVGGGVCGALFVNRRFEIAARKRLGDEIINGLKEAKVPYEGMMTNFDENAKRTFNGTRDVDVQIPGLQTDKARRLHFGYLKFTAEEMRDIFDPVIDQVLKHIWVQINKNQSKIKYLLLVGGFGTSPYLRKRVEEDLKAKDAANIVVLKSSDPWSAIARGAVICGTNKVSLKSRRARRNYGISHNSSFVAGKHPEKYKYWDTLSECYMARNQVTWYVKNGDEVSEQQEIELPFHVTFDFSRTMLIANCTLISSESERGKAEVDAKHPNVFELCDLTLDFTNLPRGKFSKITNKSGKTYYKIEVKICMKFSSAQIQFFMKFNGRKYGDTVSARFL